MEHFTGAPPGGPPGWNLQNALGEPHHVNPLNTGQKRARSLSPAPPDSPTVRSSDGQNGNSDGSSLPPPKAAKHHPRGMPHGGNSTPRLVIMHRVQCTGQSSAAGHRRHAQTALFLDQPQLFARDNRASSLRGRRPVNVRLEDYLAAEPDVSLVVVRTYDCVTYHRGVDEEFMRMPLPAADSGLPSELRPYFDVLETDVSPARAREEFIHISQPFRNAMEQLLNAEPLLFAQWEASLVPPYLQMYHLRGRMRELAGEVLDDWLGAHVVLLLDYVDSAFGRQYREADRMFDKGMVTLKYLDMLFGPNEVIVTVEEGEQVAYVSTLCPKPIRGSGGHVTHVSLQCYTWAFDGAFRRERKQIDVHWPAKDGNPIAISKLSAYPLRRDLAGELKKVLRDRGEMFWSCRKRNFVGYTAPRASFEIQVPNPRYMVDIKTHKELHAKEQGNDGPGQDDLGKELMDSDTPPEDPFVLLLPPKILGYGLHDKKWRSLLVKHLHPVRWNKKAFEQLVLDPRKKELVEAMVRIHVASNMSTDVIEGKGNGLIILLHGGPGTGKTLTAESVAELAERPLYRVTCGDIGTDPEGVERYLESVLYIGSIWKAVVLLDESDVFLEQREKTDLQRNALVSVFLRILEYYEGILILTSNRVGIFDEAFKSRVQLALHYPPLNADDRWKVWDNFINQLEQQQQQVGSGDDEGVTTKLAEGEKINIKELRNKINVLARESINGRQIRNAITTARQLALHRGQSLGYAHLEQAILVAKEFDEYVTKTQGHNDGEFARAEGLRLE